MLIFSLRPRGLITATRLRLALILNLITQTLIFCDAPAKAVYAVIGIIKTL
jgi:hypothetical protein